MQSEHRQRFLERLAQEGAAAVVPAGGTQVRNHDCDHRFRPTSDFWYLTGFDEPDAVLVLTPNGSAARSTLFVRPKDPAAEVWTGRRLGVERAVSELGVDQAFPVEELWERLPDLLAGHDQIVYRQGEDPERDAHVQNAQKLSWRRRSREGERVPLTWVDPSLWLHEERQTKTPAEIEQMRRAGTIAAEAHRLAMAACEPGKNECEIDALIGYTFRRHGCTGAAYENIVAGGANACILHYTQNDMPLRDGDLLLIDAGAEWNYYASDITRTFPVGGTFTPDQRALYEVVLRAQEAAIEATVPGAPFTQPHDTAIRHLAGGLLELGILSGELEEILEEESYGRFTIHRTSHWLGLDVHDCGAYFDAGQPRLLAPGMVLTVEPGLYIAPDDDTVDARWRGLGIRIEDDVLVTATGHEVLSEAVPKGVAEVEALCHSAIPEPVA